MDNSLDPEARHDQEGQEEEVRLLNKRVRALEKRLSTPRFSIVEVALALTVIVAGIWGMAGLAELVWSDVIDQVVKSPFSTTVLASLTAAFFAAAGLTYRLARSAALKSHEIEYRSGIIGKKIEALRNSLPRRQTENTLAGE